jgi:ABC-2 type transport system permease protein
MSLWRLHWLRLTRTARLWTLLGLYVFFGVLGPLSARYLAEIIRAAGGGLEVKVPDPTPIDGMVQFIGNAGQLGVLAIVIVGAGALAVDARPEWGAFLRTRVHRATDLVVPGAIVTTAVAIGASLAGTAVAWVGTEILLGSLDAPRMLVGVVLSSLYVAFVVGVTAAAAAVTRSTLSTVLIAVGVLIALPVLALLPPVEPWMPSELLGAPVDVLAGRAAGELLRAALTTVALVPLLLWWASARIARREV